MQSFMLCHVFFEVDRSVQPPKQDEVQDGVGGALARAMDLRSKVMHSSGRALLVFIQPLDSIHRSPSMYWNTSLGTKP